MNLILCHPFDQDAIWLYLELRKSGTPVELLAPEQLLMAREWTQSLDDDGDEFTVSIRNGVHIKSGEIDFLFNRTQLVDAPVWRHAAKGEREYVRSEMTAMLMSWLYQVQQQCRMINPPVGHSLSGAAWAPAQWAKAAFDAGFSDVATPEAPPPNVAKVLVVGDKILAGSRSRKLAQRCIDLARIAQSPLLEICVGGDGTTFAAATPLPAFRSHGNEFLALIQHQLSWKQR